MRRDRVPYLPARPTFLLTADFPYDDLLKRLEGFAGEAVWMCFLKC